MSDGSQPGQPTGCRYIAGYNQAIKLIRAHEAIKVFVASDAEKRFAASVEAELAKASLPAADRSHGSAYLAEMVGVEVRTAVVTLIKTAKKNT